MDEMMLEALEAYYKGNIKRAEANFMVYLNSPAGIGEHAEIIEAMDTQIALIAENKDKLDVVKEYQKPRSAMDFMI